MYMNHNSHPQHSATGPKKPEHRLSSKAAGYMELHGAQKDADCHKVAVTGGISSLRGCCNKFQVQDGSVIVFSCGTCRFINHG